MRQYGFIRKAELSFVAPAPSTGAQAEPSAAACLSRAYHEAAVAASPVSTGYRLDGSPPLILPLHELPVIRNVLVVCTGNICRSPIAEGLLRARMTPGGRVMSAGIGALVGHPADPLAVELMSEKGFDITPHRAQQLTRQLLSEADLVLTLERQHSDWINARYPEYCGKVHKMLRWRDNACVPDPYRQPRAAFDAAYELIEQGVEDWLKRLA